jgi:hypothetical protein
MRQHIFTPEEIREEGLDEFKVFLVHLWDYLQLPTPTPFQLDIAHYLQHGPRRLIVEAFRGVGKSWITVGFVLWNLLLDPQKKVMVVSASQPLADDFSKFCRQIIDGWAILNHLAPRMGQRMSALSFDVGPSRDSKDPSVKSAGITGQITGNRADLIVGDDVEIPKNSYTHHLRDKLSGSVKEFDAILKPDGRIVYLGTPQVEDTLYNKLETRGYKARVWPAEVPRKMSVYRGRLAPLAERIAEKHPPGTPNDPRRFNKEDLMERMASYGPSGYALQFMLDTTPASADQHPLKARDLVVHPVDEQLAPVRLVWGAGREQVLGDLQCGGFDGDFWVRPAWISPEMDKWQGTVAFIDPSARGKDETAIAIVRYAHGQLYLTYVDGWKEGFSDDTLRGLARAMIQHGCNYYVIEKNYGGGMFNKLLRPVLVQESEALGKPCPREDDEWEGQWARGNKEHRICDIMEPVLGSHSLVVDPKVIADDLDQQAKDQRYSFVYQMTRMWREKGALAHEDRLEAVSGACSYWTERMDRDRRKSVDSVKDRELRKELRNWSKSILGGRSRTSDSYTRIRKGMR